MADLGNVGSAHVTVELDFRRAIEQARAVGADVPDVEVGVEVDRTQAARELRTALQSAQAAEGKVEVEVEFDEDQLARGLRSSISGASKTALPKAGNDAGQVFGKSFSASVAKAIPRNLFAVVKPAALISGLGLAAQAASAATGGIIALTGALAPLSGAMAAFPAIAGSAAQGMGVFALATSGVTDAVGGLNEEMDPEKLKALTPPAREFARVLDSFKPRVLELQKSLQAGLFPGLTDGLRIATPLFDRLNGPLTATAQVMGELARQAARLAVSMGSDLSRVLNFNNVALRDLGEGALAFTDGLVDIMLAARPMVRFLTRGFTKIGEAFNEWAEGARANGQLAKFFGRTQTAIRSVVQVVRNLGKVLGPILSEAFPFGQQLIADFNGVLVDTAKKLDSVAGRKGLREFFEKSMPAIREAAKLVGALGSSFINLGNTPGLTDALKTIRTSLLPAFEDLIAVTTEQLVPVLLPAIENIVLVLTDLAGSSGPLKAIIEGIGDLAGKAHELFKEHPGLLNAVVTISALSAIGKATGLTGVASGIADIGFKVAILSKLSKGGAAASAGGLFAPLLAAARIAGAGLLALVTGPAAPFILVAAGLAILYIKFERFRDLVNDTIGKSFDWLSKAGDKVTDALRRTGDDVGGLTGKFADFTGLLARVPGPSQGVFGAAEKGLRGAGKAADDSKTKVSSFTDEINAAARRAAQVATQGQKTGVGLIGKVENLIGGPLTRARKLAEGLAKSAGRALAAISTSLRTQLTNTQILAVRAGISGLSLVFQRLSVNLSNARNQIQLTGIAITTQLQNRVQRAIAVIGQASLAPAGLRLMRTLLAGLDQGFDEVKAFIATIAPYIVDNKGPISADRKLLTPAGRAIMQGFDSGLQGRWGPVKKWITDIGSFFKGSVSGGEFKDVIGKLLTGGGNAASELNKVLGGKLGIPPGLLSGGLGGFLHPTSGWGDTLNQVALLQRMFGVGMTSGLRLFDTVAGPGISQHTLGQAADFGTSAGSFEQLTRLASFASRLVGSVFKQVIWQNKLWAGGGPIPNSYVDDHLDHVHLGWQGRKAGGAVRGGQAYQWNERGREMFMPSQSGYVMNATRTKELIGAIKHLSKRPGGNSSTRNAQIHVHTNATDPAAIALHLSSNLGALFGRA